MISISSKILAAKKALQWTLDALVSAAVALLLVDVLWGVFSRFLLGSPSRWTEEVAIMLLVWVALLGAAAALGRREHLGVDVLVKALDAAAAKLLAIVVQVLIIGFSSVVLIYGGGVLVSQSLRSGQVTPALGAEVGFVYLAVPLSGLFMVLFSIERIAELLTQPSSAHSLAIQESLREPE